MPTFQTATSDPVSIVKSYDTHVTLMCPWTPQLPQNFLTDAGCLRDKAAVPGDRLEEAPCIIVLIRNWCVCVCVEI